MICSIGKLKHKWIKYTVINVPRLRETPLHEGKASLESNICWRITAPLLHYLSFPQMILNVNVHVTCWFETPMDIRNIQRGLLFYY